MNRSWLGLAMVLAIACVSGPGGVTRALAVDGDGIECPEDDGWLECRAAAGDRMAIYRLGRTAYEKAREDGDYAEALRLSRQLARTGDKNGQRLLKMVHLQLSWGGHKDNVQAYAWLHEDLDAGDEYVGKLLRNLSAKMTPEQLAAAKELIAR